jgi:branched-chain amino acid transport system permease protein
MIGSYLTVIFTGLSTGVLYALVALGMYLVYSINRIFNFAHGAFVLIGSLCTYTLVVRIGVPYYITAVILIISGLLLGALLYKGVYRPMHRFGHGPTIIALLIVDEIVMQLAMLIWGRDPFQLPSFTGGTVFRLGNFVAVGDQLVLIVILIVIMILLWWCFSFTRLGKSVMALGYDEEGAALIGINIRRLVLGIWACSAALGMLAGLLIAPISYAGGIPGLMLTVKGFEALLIGGTATPFAPVIGALVLGLLEALLGRWFNAGYVDIILMIILLALMLISPNGLITLFTKRRGIR